MTYHAEISRTNPTSFLFLIDQSGSMSDRLSTGKTKAEHVADVLNRTLATLITRCSKSEGIRNYFEVGVIGYGDKGAYNGFQGELSSSIIHPISSLEAIPLRLEDRVKKIDDGAGGLIEQSIKFPVWVDPLANGGTPMRAAIGKAIEALAVWCDSHLTSYPPTVLHITDGESTDGDPEEYADHLRSLKTEDGHVLMFNLHLSADQHQPVEFPASAEGLPNSYSQLLFRMSSVLPDHLIGVVCGKVQKLGFKDNFTYF